MSHAKTQAEGKARPKIASYLPPLGSPQCSVATKSMGKKGFSSSSHHPKFTRSISIPASPVPLPPQSMEPLRTSLKPPKDLDHILHLLIRPCCDNKQALMGSLPHLCFGGSRSYLSHFILFSAFSWGGGGKLFIVHHVPWFQCGFRQPRGKQGDFSPPDIHNLPSREDEQWGAQEGDQREKGQQNPTASLVPEHHWSQSTADSRASLVLEHHC